MPPAPPATGTVRAADGTAISYRQLGTGPGLVLVHGGMQASQNLLSLAGALSGQFTIYIPDRRGRAGVAPIATIMACTPRSATFRLAPARRGRTMCSA